MWFDGCHGFRGCVRSGFRRRSFPRGAVVGPRWARVSPRILAYVVPKSQDWLARPYSVWRPIASIADERQSSADEAR